MRQACLTGRTQAGRTLVAMTTLPAPAPARRRRTALDLLRGAAVRGAHRGGLSTDSGIPDYRGPTRPARMPMTYSRVRLRPAAQQRYWARSHLGWSRMRRADPNAGHHALAALEAAGRLRLLITQNVDGLHEAAGSRAVCALHGRIADVVCLGCRAQTSRGGAARAAAASSTPAGPSGTPTSRSAPTATSSSTTPPGSWSRLRARAAACSSPTWCSSARTSPSRGWSAATPRWTPSTRPPTRCWCSARR